MSDCKHEKVYVASDGEVYCDGCGDWQYDGEKASVILNAFGHIEKALKIARGPFRAELWPDLTARERRILSLVLMGWSNTGIGTDLNLSRQGATYAVNAVCQKIGTTREGLAMHILGLIEKALETMRVDYGLMK